VIANRNQIQHERLIGMFANTIILRTDLSGEPTFTEVLRRVRQVTLDAYRNQDLPLEKVLQTIQVPRSMDRNFLSQVMFILQTPARRPPALPGLSVRFTDIDPGIARADLLLELMETDSGLGGWFEYSTDVFDAETIAALKDSLKDLAKPKGKLAQLRDVAVFASESKKEFDGLLCQDLQGEIDDLTKQVKKWTDEDASQNKTKINTFQALIGKLNEQKTDKHCK